MAAGKLEICIVLYLPNAMRNLLILSSFLLLFVITSCKESNTEKKIETTTEKSSEQNASETDSTASSGSILFFGDSLTAGYGLDDPDDAFPALIQQKIDSLGLNYTVTNAGLSGETTAGGKSRLNWVLDQPVDIFVLELGANDGLRGIPIEETHKNLQAIIDAVREKDPETKIVLAGMQLPPNLGTEYTKGFQEIFPQLAEKNDVTLIPFLLKDVGGVESMNQADGIHPTAEGAKIVANTVWEVLKLVLEE